MYRRLAKYSVSMLAIMLIAGCSNDMDLETRVEERVPVVFELASKPLNCTRATYDNNSTWNTGIDIAVKCTASSLGETTVGTVKNYVTADNGSGGIKLKGKGDAVANTFYWLLKNDSKSFCMWYPYSGSQPTVGPAVAADQSAVTNDVFASYDLLYAEVKNITAANMPFAGPVSFYHQMSRLTVTITKGTGTTAETVQSVQIGTANVAVSTTAWTPATSNYNSSTSSGGASFTPGSKNQTITLRHLSDLNYTCILPPQTIGSASTVLLTITTKDANNVTHVYQKKDALTLYAGNHHTIAATISRVGFSISTNVTDWETPTTSTSGSVTF